MSTAIPADVRERVIQAAQELYEQSGGETMPTVDAVRRLARVDMNSASAVMREWRRSQTAQASSPKFEQGLHARDLFVERSDVSLCLLIRNGFADAAQQFQLPLLQGEPQGGHALLERGGASGVRHHADQPVLRHLGSVEQRLPESQVVVLRVARATGIARAVGRKLL